MVGLNFSRNMEVCLRNKDTAEMQDERKRKEIESINKGKRAVLCHLADVASKGSPNLRHLSGIITSFGRGCRAYLLSSDVDEKLQELALALPALTTKKPKPGDPPEWSQRTRRPQFFCSSW